MTHTTLRSTLFPTRRSSDLGKSNLADCLDFISEIYRHGLEMAVARKGGYENIAFRRMRRAKGGISVDMTVMLSGQRSEEHTSELQSQSNLVCRLLLEKKK